MQRQQAKEGTGMIGSLAILSVKVSKFRKMRVRFHTVKQPEPDQNCWQNHRTSTTVRRQWPLKGVTSPTCKCHVRKSLYLLSWVSAWDDHRAKGTFPARLQLSLIPFPLFCVLLQWSETWLRGDLHPGILNHDLTNNEKLPGKVKNEIYPMEGQQYVPGLED